MIKKLHLASLIMLVMILVVSCAPKPAPTPAPTPIPTPVAAEPIVDEVATDISDANTIDEELDTSELDGVDSILADIENI